MTRGARAGAQEEDDVGRKTNRVGGILFLTIAGTSYRVQGDFEITPGGTIRTAVECENAIGGFSGKPRTPMIKGTILDPGDLDVASVDAIEDQPVVLGLGNGRAFVLGNAWSSIGAYTTKDGGLAIELSGKTGEFVDGAFAF